MDSNIISTLIGSGITLISILGTLAAIRLTAKNDRGTHISKTRFDKEFEIYQELSEKNLNAVYDGSTAVVFVRGMYSEQPQKIKEHLLKYKKSLSDAEFSNKKYAPFIDKEIFQKYKELQSMNMTIFSLFTFWAGEFIGTYTYKGKTYTKDDILVEIETKQKTMSKLSDELLDNIRVYLKGLDVIK